jgi:hypothetical protein
MEEVVQWYTINVLIWLKIDFTFICCIYIFMDGVLMEFNVVIYL